MAYIKNTWVNQEVERPRTYQKEDHADGSFTLIDDFGLVSELGTPVNADNMNHIEEGIGEHEERITALENLPDVYLKTNQITNCITEIPQRIKLELTDGRAHLKAGTVVIIPYGTEDLTAQLPIGSTFINENLRVVDTQYIVDNEGNGQFFVWTEMLINNDTAKSNDGEYIVSLGISGSEIEMLWSYEGFSGAGVAPSTYDICYDTTTNLVTRYGSDTTIGYMSSFPLFHATVSGGVCTAINEVFNGVGYIGSTIWVDKGVKGLAPNGRNKDYTLKSNEININSLEVVTLPTNYTFQGDILCKEGYIAVWAMSDNKYNPNTNFRYYQNNTEPSLTLNLGSCTVTDGVISDFKPKQPFRAVDYDTAWIARQGSPSGKYISLTATNNKTYTAPADGYFSMQGSGANNQNGKHIQMFSMYVCMISSAQYNVPLGCCIRVKKGGSMTLYHNCSTINAFRFIYAEGDTP